MRRRVQISFLSVFLTMLTVAFATALMVRVRSYSVTTATESAASSTTAATASAAQRSKASPVSFEPLPAQGTTMTTSSVPVATTSSAAATTRAQRFRELFAAGISAIAPSAAPAAHELAAPPKPVATPPQTKPPAPVSRPSTRPQGSMAGGSAAGGSNQPGISNENKPKPPSNDPRDPNSDTAPPQLLSIVFDPPAVQDGGDTTLVVTATDDLSGIRGISGTLTSPNGKAVQGFAQQREGETMRYTSRIHIPEKAEEGLWKVSFLTMSDMATNSVTLSAAQGTLPPTALLKVSSSASDSTAPTLRNVWLERRAMRAGEHNTLFVDALDEKSGIHLVAAVFLSPSKLARFGVGCQKGANDIYQCDVFPPQCLDCGDWTLEQVQMQDNANNFATVRAENPTVAAIRLNITGDSCDNTPPALQGLQLSRAEIFMGRDEPVIEVIAQVTDDSCGIGGVSGQVVGPGSSSSGTFFSFQQRDGNTYVGTIRLHANSARGVWRVQSVTVNDKGQNLKIYYSNDPLLARASFTVK
ncbi:MAG: hypothetical protein JO088_13075 [Acidobacteria bacterium]|nr:hypothetical protein [Acidobacteriota bacterium]